MKRPWYLTALLALFLIGALIQIFGVTAGSEVIKQLVPNMPSWYIPVLLILSVVDLVALVMLWMWKMMGFYLTVGVTIAGSVISFIFQGTASLWTAALSAVGLVLLYLVMRPVWKNFA